MIFSNDFIVSVLVPWCITGALIVSIVCTLLLLPSWIRSLRAIPIHMLGILCAIVAGGIYVRFALTDNTHRIYYDEDRYLTYAVSFARYGQAKALIYALDRNEFAGYPDQAIRLTIPTINAWIMKFTGYSEKNTFVVAKIFSCIQIVLIMVFSYLLFNSQIIVVFVAIVSAFLPPFVYWSTSVGLDSYFVFFSLLSLVTALLYVEKPNRVHALFSICALLLFLCVRLEAIALVPALAYLFWRKRNPKHLPIVLSASIIVFIRAVLSISVLREKWCCAEGLPIEAFHFEYFFRNILPNVGNLFTRIEFPFMITVLAALSILRMRNWKIGILSYWFFTYFFLYSTYYAGMFYSGEFSGSYGRYLLILIPPLILMAGDFINRTRHRRIVLGVFVLSCIPSLYTYRTLINTSPYYALVDEGPVIVHTAISSYILPDLPQDAILLSSMVSATIMDGHAGGLFGSFLSDRSVRDVIIQELKKGKKVYSTAPYQCITYPQQCALVADLVEFTPVSTKNGNVIYAEITLKK